jgi:hypothetical protein
MPSHRIPDDLYQVVAADAGYRCGYCQAPQAALPYRLEIEHLRPSPTSPAVGKNSMSGNFFELFLS